MAKLLKRLFVRKAYDDRVLESCDNCGKMTNARLTSCEYCGAPL